MTLTEWMLKHRVSTLVTSSNFAIQRAHEAVALEQLNEKNS